MWSILASLLLPFALLSSVALADHPSGNDTPTATSSTHDPVVSLLMFNTKQQLLQATVVAAERPAGPTTFQLRCDNPNKAAPCSLKQPTIVELTPNKSYKLNTIQHGHQVSYDCKLRSQQPISCTYKEGDHTEEFIPGVKQQYSYFFLPVKVTQGSKMLGKLPQELSGDYHKAADTPTSSADSSSTPSTGTTQKPINGDQSGAATPGFEVDLRITLWLTTAAAVGAALIAA